MISLHGNVDFALSRLKGSLAVPGSGNSIVPNPNFKYAAPITAYTPNKYANRQVTAQSQVTYTQPQFYSPLHTPQNWQIPSKRREVMQWLRYFVENEPKIGAGIDFYANFPMNGFETQCNDSKIKKYYDNLNKKLNLDHWCKMISREYYLIGDVFPFLEIGCEKCNGTNVVNGKRCNHPGGTFNRIVVLNPDWIDVQQNQFVDEPVITMMPDDELKRVVWQKRPKPIYDRLPMHIRQLILAGKPIPLDPANISHLKHDPYPYGVYGTSLIRRLFKTLTYKDKLMTAQWIVAERLILPIRIVKVGNDERPAGASDLADVQQQLAQTAQDPNLTLITHHALEYDWIGASGKVLTLSNEFELINKEILQGLMLNDALLDGTMAGYQSAAIGAEALVQRIESWRLDLGRWIEDRIYKPVAQMRGFIDEEASKELGEPVWIYPKIKWNDLNIRDDTQQKGLWLQLHERQLMSGESLLEKFDLDYDQEIERIRLETAAQQVGAAPGGGGAGGMGAAPPGGGMGGDLFGGGGAGGGAGGMPPPGGEVPGAGGMGGEPGGMPPPGGEMGGGGGAPPPTMGGTMGKILPTGRASKNSKAPKEEVVQPAGIKLTSLEQIMFKMLLGFKQQGLPLNTWVQFPLGQYRADFAMPQIKLAIECDGEAWHSHPDKKASDKRRDTELSRYGWTTVRFSEAELKEQQQAVKSTLLGMIQTLWKKAVEAQEKQKKSMQKVQELAGETKTSSVGMIVEAGLENRPPMLIEAPPPNQS